jgi:hypothetical protein
MERDTDPVQLAEKCSWKSLSPAMLACPGAHHLPPKKTATYEHSLHFM